MKIQLTLALVSLSVLVHAQGVPDHYNVTEILVPGSSGGEFHQTQVDKITNSGKIVGTRYLNGVAEAYWWDKSTGYHVVPRATGTYMWGLTINESGVIGGAVFDSNDSSNGYKYDPVNGMTVYPYSGPLPFGGTQLNEINDQGDMMFWTDDFGSNGSFFKRSKLVRADGSSVTYGVYEEMDLPTPSGHQHGSRNAGGGLIDEFVIMPDGQRFEAGASLEVQDDGDIYADGSSSQSHIYRFGPDGSLIWRSPQYWTTGNLVVPKHTKQGFLRVQLTSTSPARPYMTLFGGNLIDLTPKIPSNVVISGFRDTNDSGQVLAYGSINGVPNKEFLLTPVPEPGTMVAIGLGLAGLSRRRKRAVRGG